MKVSIDYVIDGKFITKTVSLRSMDSTIAKALKKGAWALSITRYSDPKPTMTPTQRAAAYSDKFER